MKHLLLWLIVLVCAACGGNATQQPTSQFVPPQISTASIPETGVPSEIISAIMAQTRQPSNPDAPVLPFQVLGTQPAAINALNPIINFTELVPGMSATISGTFRLITDGSSAAIPVVVDPGENQVIIQINPEILAQYVDQSIQIGGIVIQEGDQLILQDPTIITSTNPQSLPFLQSSPQAPPPLFATFEPEALNLQLAPNLTALAAHDALVENLGDELVGIDWVGAAGMPAIGWIIDFYDPEELLSIQYTVTPEGIVQRRKTTSEPLSCITHNPIIRAQVTVDSSHVYEQIGTSEVIITLRAPGCDTPAEWILRDSNVPPIPAS